MKKIEKDFMKENNNDYGIGIRGEVFFYKNGKLLFKKSNMIVDSGRKYLREIFLAKTGLLSYLPDNNNTPDSLIFGKIVLGTGSRITERSMTYDSIKNTLIDSYSVSIFNSANSPSENEIIRNEEGNSISFKINIEGNPEYPILAKELAMLLEDPEIQAGDEKYTLFSRISFDGVPLGSGSDLEIEYFVYF